MSELKVNTISNASGTNSISIGSDGSISYPNFGRKNLIINGAMQVAQRGTSSTGLGDGVVGYKVLDRYRLQKAGSPTARYTMTQDSDAPDAFGSSLKLEVTTAQTSFAATDYQYIDQFIEAQNVQSLAWGTSSGKEITLSFYVKCSTAQTFAIDFINEDNSQYFNTTYAISSANAWEYKTITIPADSSNGFNNDNGRGLRVRWALTAGSDFVDGSISTTWSGTQDRATNHDNTWVATTGATFYLTGVQLEVGSVATPFEHRSYGEELALCQRYYYKPIVSVTNIAASGSGYATGASQSRAARFTTNLPVSMRASGTVTVISFSGGNCTVGQQYSEIDTFTWYPLSSAAGSCFWNGEYSIDAEL